METLPYVIGIIIALLLLYKIASLIYFLNLKAKLKHADLNTFTKVLGENHKHRLQFNGLIRYKWSKGWVIIKANFDENGNLIYNKIIPQIIFRLKSELLFVF